MADPVQVLGPGGSPLTFGPDTFVTFAAVAAERTSNPQRKRRLRPAVAAAIGATSYLSAADLVRRVTNFAQRQPEWAEGIIYETKPDEAWDLTLVSQRVYGRRDEFLTVMAAAGLDSVEQELTPRRIVLPSERQLAEMKSLAGFVNDPWGRSPELSADPVLGR